MVDLDSFRVGRVLKGCVVQFHVIDKETKVWRRLGVSEATRLGLVAIPPHPWRWCQLCLCWLLLQPLRNASLASSALHSFPTVLCIILSVAQLVLLACLLCRGVCGYHRRRL